MLNMSRRLILRTTSRLFTITTTQYAPRYLLPLVSRSNAVVSCGHLRRKHTASYRSHQSKKGKDGRADRLKKDSFELSSSAYSALKGIGMRRTEASNLVGAIQGRTIEARGLRFVFECLRNREIWLQNETKIPKAYQKLWESSRIIDTQLHYDLAAIGPHSDAKMGAACHVIGLDLLRRAELDYDTAYMSFGCFMLELAVLYERHDAAAHLINYYNNPARANTLVQAPLQTSTREAEVLIRDLATTSPSDTPDGAMLVYLREEYSPRKIVLQNPKQLQWGFTISQSIDVTDTNMLKDAMPFDVYIHPARIRLQIIEHCLSKSISLPELPLTEMPQERNTALEELAGINDPHASMILAVGEDGPKINSEEWERLLLAAAAGGIPQACLLLSIHNMHKEGILPIGPDTKAKLKTSLGLEFGRICILAYLEDPSSFVGITVAFAALCRAAGDYDLGLTILEESVAVAKNDTKFPRRNVAQLEDDHIRDYKLKEPRRVGYWSQAKCEKFLPVFDADRAMGTARNVYH